MLWKSKESERRPDDLLFVCPSSAQISRLTFTVTMTNSQIRWLWRAEAVYFDDIDVLQRPPSHLPDHDSITPCRSIDPQECRTKSRRISCLCSGPILAYYYCWYYAPSQTILFFESCCHRCVVIISPCLPSAAAASTAAGCRGRRPLVQCRPAKSGHEQQRQLISNEN